MKRPASKGQVELAPVAELFPPPRGVDRGGVLSLPDTNRFIELSEGRLIMPPHPTFAHQTALQHLFLKPNDFVERRQLGIVRFALLPVRLWPGKIREPVFIVKEHRDRIGERVCDVPTSLSRSSRPRRLRRTGWRSSRGTPRPGWQSTGWSTPQARTIEVYTLQQGAYLLRGKWGEKASSGLLAGFEVGVRVVGLASLPGGCRLCSTSRSFVS